VSKTPNILTPDDIARLTWNTPGDYGNYGNGLFVFIRRLGDCLVNSASHYLEDLSRVETIRPFLDLQATVTNSYVAGFGPHKRWPKFGLIPPETDDLTLMTSQWIDAARTTGIHILGMIARTGTNILSDAQKLVVANPNVLTWLAAHATRGINVNSPKGARQKSAGLDWSPPVHVFRTIGSSDGIPELDLATDTPYARLRNDQTHGVCPAFHRPPETDSTSVEMLSTFAPLFMAPLVQSVRDFYHPDLLLPTTLDAQQTNSESLSS
jgi:hypothetical protein